jgi:hypothetical protein
VSAYVERVGLTCRSTDLEPTTYKVFRNDSGFFLSVVEGAVLDDISAGAFTYA